MKKIATGPARKEDAFKISTGPEAHGYKDRSGIATG